MTLKLVNNLTKKEYEFEVIDANTSKLFYNLSITLPSGMADGEYNYFLTDGDTALASGLCIVGDHTPEKSVYENKNTYIQYK